MLKNGAVVPVLPQPMPSSAGRPRWSMTVRPSKSGGAPPNGRTKPTTRAASPATKLARLSVPVATS